MLKGPGSQIQWRANVPVSPGLAAISAYRKRCLNTYPKCDMLCGRKCPLLSWGTYVFIEENVLENSHCSSSFERRTS